MTCTEWLRTLFNTGPDEVSSEVRIRMFQHAEECKHCKRVAVLLNEEAASVCTPLALAMIDAKAEELIREDIASPLGKEVLVPLLRKTLEK